MRNLYRIFQESRSAARKRATLAVTGGPPQAVTALADVLGAQRNADGAEVILTVTGASGGIEVGISGGAIEDAETVYLSTVSREVVTRELAPWIADNLDEDYLVALGRGYPALRRAVCEEIIRHNARQNAVIGVLPIPGADMPAITANQGRMVLGIAAAYDEELSMERARELIGVLAAGFGLRALSRQLLKLVPVAGWAAAGIVGTQERSQWAGPRSSTSSAARGNRGRRSAPRSCAGRGRRRRPSLRVSADSRDAIPAVSRCSP